MTDQTTTAEQTTDTEAATPALFTQADLDTVKRLGEAAAALWPTFATGMRGMSVSRAEDYQFVGIDGDGDAVFHRSYDDGRIDDEYMSMDYVLDNQSLIEAIKVKQEADARAEQERRERAERERRLREDREAAAARARQEAADQAAWLRHEARIAAGTATRPTN